MDQRLVTVEEVPVTLRSRLFASTSWLSLFFVVLGRLQ